MKVASTVAALVALVKASPTAPGGDMTALQQAVTECYSGMQNMGSCATDFAVMGSTYTGGATNAQIRGFCSSTCFTTLKDTFVAMGECVSDATKDNWPADTPLPDSTKQMFESMGGMYGDMIDFMCTYDPAKEQYCMTSLNTFSTAMAGLTGGGQDLCDELSSMGCCLGSLAAVTAQITAASGVSNPWEKLCPNNAFSAPCLKPGETEAVIMAKLKLENVKAEWLAGRTDSELNELERGLKAELAAKWGCDASQISIGDLKTALTGTTVVVAAEGQVTLKSTAVVEAKLTMIPSEALVDPSKPASASPGSVEEQTLKGEAGADKTSDSSRVAASVVMALALAALA